MNPDQTPQAQSPPASGGPRTGWERELTERFRQTLSTQRMNALSNRSAQRFFSAAVSSPANTFSDSFPNQFQLPARHGSGSRPARAESSPLDDFALGAPPSASTPQFLRNIPLVPRAPTEAAHLRFRNELHMLSDTPIKWENPGLLDEAMKSIPLDRIYAEADEQAQLMQATAASMGKKPAWAEQDCIIRALLKWFRRQFFTWVNNPACSRCGAPTVASVSEPWGAPTPDERALGAARVELYNCHNCGSRERFARYNDAFVLLQTRRGRLGEWVNCFGMLCRAMGSRVRWVWSSEDHTWCEIYSEYRKRWVHVDPCEEAFDKPLLYTEGWGKQLRYCIAFSADGVTDVTNRYCRNPIKYGLERNKVPEEVLLFIIDEIRNKRRENKPKDEKFRLEGEDAQESRELRHYYVSTLTQQVANLIPAGQPRPQDADAQKAAEGRQNAAMEQSLARNQHGQTPPHNHHDPSQR